MSTTMQTFVHLMEQFLQELQECFPSESRLKVYVNKFEILKKSNPRKVFELFMEHISPYKDLIINKNDTLMTDEDIPLNKELGFSRIWNSKEATDNTKDAIWAHLNTLLVFGSTIQEMPTGLMQGIESLAKEYASQIDESQMNPELLMGSVQNMLCKLQKE